MPGVQKIDHMAAGEQLIAAHFPAGLSVPVNEWPLPVVSDGRDEAVRLVVGLAARSIPAVRLHLPLTPVDPPTPQ